MAVNVLRCLLSDIQTSVYSILMNSKVFYFHVTVHRNKFLYNKTNQMHRFPKFTPA